MTEPLVVVGAGAAGAVIAARVTESDQHEVRLIEAGPDRRGDALPPDLFDGRKNSITDHDWGYRAVFNRSQDTAPLPRGRVVGGSSAVNTCIALRGQPYDYDEWAERAGDQWRWETCAPYFRKLETDLDIDNEHHGQDGPIQIRRHKADELVPFQAACLDGLASLGHPRCDDHNDPTTTGAGPHCMNKVDGKRISAAVGYLTNPVRRRRNLRLEPHTHVHRVVFEGRRVRAIELVKDGRLERRATRKVVLCGGSVATPGILVRSGIGPRAMLEKLGVDVVVDAPVGLHLRDHPGTAAILVPKAGVASGEHPLIQTTMRYKSASTDYDNEMQLQPVSFLQMPGVPLLVGITICIGKTAGTGTLRYASAKPLAKPIVEPELGHDVRDRVRLVEGLSLAYELATTPAVRAVADVAWPNPKLLARGPDDSDWVLPGTGSGYHPCSTAPMGDANHPEAVVDGFGRVHGVEGLFVADASIMPTIPSANLHLATLMIGERFGEWFREGKL